MSQKKSLLHFLLEKALRRRPAEQSPLEPPPPEPVPPSSEPLNPTPPAPPKKTVRPSRFNPHTRPPRKAKRPAPIPPETNLNALFLGSEKPTEREALPQRALSGLQPQESFEDLLLKHRNHPDQIRLMQEKIQDAPPASVGKPRRPSQEPRMDITLDLHGSTLEQAREQMITFLNRIPHESWRWAAIICGKGHHSGGAPVIRPALATWLRQAQREGRLLAWWWDQKEEQKSGVAWLKLRP